MNFLPVFLFFSILSCIKPCVRTIPPEEVYITSTGANLPFTNEPDDVTEGGAGPGVPVTNGPVTNAPATNAPVTDTTASSCTTCDMNDIAPMLDDTSVTAFEFEDERDDEGCVKNTVATCKRTDGKTCANIKIRMTNPDGTTDAATGDSVKELSEIFVCTDQEYASVFTGSITRLHCDFTNCN